MCGEREREGRECLGMKRESLGMERERNIERDQYLTKKSNSLIDSSRNNRKCKLKLRQYQTKPYMSPVSETGGGGYAPQTSPQRGARIYAVEEPWLV